MKALSDILNGPYSYSTFINAGDIVVDDKRTMSPREFGRKMVGRKSKKKRSNKR